MKLVEITSRYFVAGIELNPDGRVVDAAPILHYMIGWDEDRVSVYVENKGWSKEIVVPYDSKVLHGPTKITLPKPSSDTAP